MDQLRRKEIQQSGNLSLNDGEEVGDGGGGARGERQLGNPSGERAHYLLQPLDVR